MSSPGAHTRQFNNLSRFLECNELVYLLSSSGAPLDSLMTYPGRFLNEQVYLLSSSGSPLDSLVTYLGPFYCCVEYLAKDTDVPNLDSLCWSFILLFGFQTPLCAQALRGRG